MHGTDRVVERSIEDVSTSIDTIRLAIATFGNPPRGLVSLLRDEEVRLASLERFRDGVAPKALPILTAPPKPTGPLWKSRGQLPKGARCRIGEG